MWGGQGVVLVLEVPDERVLLQLVGVGGEDLELSHLWEHVVAVGGCGEHFLRQVGRSAEQLRPELPHVGGCRRLDVGGLCRGVAAVEAVAVNALEALVGGVGQEVVVTGGGSFLFRQHRPSVPVV